MNLSLGTAQLGLHYGIANYHGPLTDVEAWRLLDAAWGCGIRHLDTAPIYGKAEERINQWHKWNAMRMFEVTTKVRHDQGTRLDRPCRRLWHYLDESDVEPMADVDGMSCLSGDDVRRLGCYPYGIYQLPASALDGRSDRIMGELYLLGFEVQVRSLLIQGHATQLPFLRRFAADFGLTIPALCVRWAYELPVDTAIVGAEIPQQVEENAAAFADGPLPRDLVELILELRPTVPEWAISPRTWGQKYDFG